MLKCAHYTSVVRPFADALQFLRNATFMNMFLFLNCIGRALPHEAAVTRELCKDTKPACSKEI